ncbi:THUMP domain-containing protein 2 [Liparis tanakae]|uniref:THUMP domain-containing protein 2 n=1 Tax=Liparis tanakae TaxID=230148 RepID=A0A4Z2I470_9TELE|nr:THUMP domain-containing protein 2 [Liparis tanakae]
MSHPDTGGSVVRYYCTAGNGMQRFLIGEVKEKLAAEDVCQTAGKVLFSSSAAIHRVSALKAAERLFLLLRSDAPLRLPSHTGPAKAAALLRSRLLGDVSQWAGAAVTWRRLQGELAARRTKEGRRGERERGDEESSRGTCGVEAPTLKRERDEEEEKEPERKRRCEEDDGGEEASAENMHHDEVKPSAEAPPPEPALSFRVSCKCTGSLSRCFGSQVNVSLSDDHFLLGFPLTRLPLANRSYMKTTGLRSTVAWAMASLAEIQPGSCVVDPMCGVGTILVEAAQEHEAACFLGLDLDDGQLQRANENVEFAELRDRMQLLRASCMRIPVTRSTIHEENQKENQQENQKENQQSKPETVTRRTIHQENRQ